jgi:CDP-diacylglycerol--serine O-phosphatidyltransferase
VKRIVFVAGHCATHRSTSFFSMRRIVAQTRAASFAYASEVTTPARRHMSMLRSYTWADALTIGNASCGTISIFLCLDYLATANGRFLWTAFLLLPLALVCDVLDGYVARLDKKRQSVMGADLDSLADVISFGVAPAVLGFTLGLRGGWDMLVLTYFVVCGVSRLARFNVTAADLSDSTTGKVKYFEGTPIPTSIAIVLLLGVAVYLGRVDDALWFGVYKIGPALLHPLTLIYGLSGSAMISATLRVPKP